MACLFVRESEDSTLQPKLHSPNSAPLQPSKTIPKPRKDSTSASRKPKSSETFYSSMEDPSTASWIASLRAGRANPTQSPADAKEQATSAGSGATSSASSAKPGPLSSSERTSQGSSGTPIAVLAGNGWMSPQMTLLAEWERFSGIWPRWGLMRGGEAYELPTWAPRTAGRESSYWPTADAQVINEGESHDLVAQVEQWPTPNARDEKNPTNPSGARAARKAEQGWTVDLNDVAAHWQTQATDSFRSRGGDRKDEMGLDQQARFWPGPKQRDWKNGEGIGGLNRHAPDLSVAAPQWKTPHGLQYKPEEGDPGGGGEFAKQVENWESSPLAHPIRTGLPFWQRYRILRLLCQELTQRLPSPYKRGRSIFKRKLNPNFVDWLMGWPAGWSSVDRVFSAEEMESYRSRLRRSLANLLGGQD